MRNKKIINNILCVVDEKGNALIVTGRVIGLIAHVCHTAALTGKPIIAGTVKNLCSIDNKEYAKFLQGYADNL